MTKYKDYTKEQLIEEIKYLKSRKKFGLVWEDKPEDVVTECKTKFPVLREDHERAILDDNSPSSPTHLIIEGDNHHSLSTLNVTRKGKIDVIYIDPPFRLLRWQWDGGSGGLKVTHKGKVDVIYI